VVSGLENPWHWVVLLVVLLLVFGPKRLPQLGRSLGGGIREFRHSVTGSGESSPETPKRPEQGSLDAD
jgi:sec-independent protein translocase protein TatA